jgi:hypothetical protein
VCCFYGLTFIDFYFCCCFVCCVCGIFLGGSEKKA